MIDTSSTSPVLAAVTEIAAAFVSKNKVAASDLPGIIQVLHKTVSGLIAGSVEAVVEAGPTKPTAAQIRKSISDKGLVSFEDGRIYQTLKRHLTLRGLTPAQYKEKWGLPSDYPTTAPAYTAKRSALAKAVGLGRRIEAAPVAEPVAKTAGRARKTKV